MNDEQLARAIALYLEGRLWLEGPICLGRFTTVPYSRVPIECDADLEALLADDYHAWTGNRPQFGGATSTLRAVRAWLGE